MQIREILPELQGQLVYLATPYTVLLAKNEGPRAAHAAAVWTRYLAANGVTAISPVVLSHEACKVNVGGSSVYFSDCDGGSTLLESTVNPLEHEMWMNWCAPLQAACSSIVIPPIAGRDGSSGIRAEIEIAQKTGQSVYWLSLCKADKCPSQKLPKTNT